MEMEDLAEIFEDPLLNDLTDNLLSDIDLQELENFSIDCEEHSNKCSQQTPFLVEKSNHATLEALLKSQPPHPSVPPAPDLHSNNNLPTNFDTRSDSHPDYNHWNMHHQDRSSNPIPIPQYNMHNGKPKTEITRISPKSKLICDYLEKCSTEPPPRFILRPAPEFYRSRHLGISEGTQPEVSEWENSASQRPLVHVSNGFQVQSSNVWASNAATDDCDASSKSTDRPAKRAPHNAIEKRYRASINGRIDELRKILIPFPSADAKLNKSAVLRQAIERIKELEAKNERLCAEVMSLRRLHTSHLSKSYNSSPESGISLDPSPTSSNYACLEFDRITPPSITDSYSSLYNLNGALSGGALTTSCSTDHSNSCAMTDTCNTTPWSLTMSSPEKPDSSLLSRTAPLDMLMDDYSLLDGNGSGYPPTVGDEIAVAPPDVSQYLIRGDSMDQTYQQRLGCQIHSQSAFMSAARTTGNRGKRVACSTAPGPPKVRRQLAPKPIQNGQFVSNTFSQGKCSPPDPFPSTMIKTESQLPGVRGMLLSNPQEPQSGPEDPGQSAQPVGSISRKLVDYAVPAGGFNDLAARTTLCVSALCLVALDPAALTATSSESSGQQNVNTARRLLTTSSLFTSPFSTWVNCLLYLVQWIVALTLCFWAWKRGTVRGAFQSPKGTQFGERVISTEARSHWIKANVELDQGDLVLSERHLRKCLDVLNASLPDVPGYTQSFRRAWAWCVVGLNTFRLLCIYVPCRGCKFVISRMAAWLIPPRSACSVDCKNHTPSPTVIRSRLLELYLLAFTEHRSNATTGMSHVDGLSFARLFLTCFRDFVDASVNPSAESPSEWTRQGIVLVLVFSQVVRSMWLSRTLMHWITADARLNFESKVHHSAWSYVATNPCFVTVLTSRRALALPPVDSVPTVLYRFPDRLWSALNHEMTTQCLRVILYGTNGELNNLEPTINALLHFIPSAATATSADQSDYDERYSTEPLESDAGTASRAHAVERCRWWVHLLHTVWLQRISSSQKHSPEVNPLSDARLSKPLPNLILACSASGPLIQALWLVYGNPQKDYCSIEAAKQACHLLRKSIHRLSPFTGSHKKHTVNQLSSDLFQIMAWHWLALDRVLTALVGSLLSTGETLGTDGLYPVDTSTMSSLTLTLSILRQLSNSYNSSFTQPRFIARKLSYAETVHRLANGANPVRTRLALMQYNQTARSRSATERVEIPQFVSHSVEPMVRDQSRINNRSAVSDYPHAREAEEESHILSDLTQQKAERLARYFDNPCTTMTTLHWIADRQPGLLRCNAVTQSPGQ